MQFALVYRLSDSLRPMAAHRVATGSQFLTTRDSIVPHIPVSTVLHAAVVKILTFFCSSILGVFPPARYQLQDEFAAATSLWRRGESSYRE